jgi:hypothetical protein
MHKMVDMVKIGENNILGTDNCDIYSNLQVSDLEKTVCWSVGTECTETVGNVTRSYDYQRKMVIWL